MTITHTDTGPKLIFQLVIITETNPERPFFFLSGMMNAVDQDIKSNKDKINKDIIKNLYDLSQHTWNIFIKIMKHSLKSMKKGFPQKQKFNKINMLPMLIRKSTLSLG